MAGTDLFSTMVRSIRRRTRHAVVVAVLAALSVAMLAGAAALQGYWYDLSLNVGASLVLVIATYLIFNPLFAELQAANIREHHRLDYSRFIHEVEHAHGRVDILETWTGLLEPPYLEGFLDAVRHAAGRGVAVKILLLDPDSNAAVQRTEELGGHDVRSAILTNLRDLYSFWRTVLDPEVRRLVDIRVYDAMPSVQLYRWDDKAFISFYPLGQLAYDTPQIEAFMATPWGEFVQNRFDEMWAARDTRRLDAFMTMRMALSHHGSALGDCRADFVLADGTFYVDTPVLVNHVVKLGRDGIMVRCDLPGASVTAAGYRVDPVVVEPQRGEIRDLFVLKYGHAPDVVIRLVPDGHAPAGILARDADNLV
ncbi:hypothetical protein [Actinocatenispora rupis]|uniref:Uncharacterized protein n=1 Tax=Actinocatenispora rupis TaxID=519421 RepID=A0A8J3JBY5_9ACTN|nr:hypothetical protein [Actinocatenispora rupis]GID12003.1 hypothetical protein Aru02nite_28920 [Actinocatenispora rupis]